MPETLIPDLLLDTVKSSLQTASNFYVLGELEAIDDFREALIKNLSAQGWPVDDEAARWKNGSHHMFETMTLDSWMTKPKDEDWRRNLSYWVEQLSEEMRPFFLKPGKLLQLEKAVEQATAETAKTYGDPQQVKHGQLSGRRAMFNAIAAHLEKDETAETKLWREMRRLVRALRAQARQHGVSSLDFQRMIEENLRRKAWPIDAHEKEQRDLSENLWRLAQAAELKTSLPFRLALQDATSPPHKPARAAKDFILAHTGDIRAGVNEVTAEIDRSHAAKARPSFPKRPGP